MNNIFFYTEEPLKFILRDKNKIRIWLNNVVESEGFHIKNLNYIFCTDEYLYKMNLQYLKHDTYTDVITFDQSETDKTVEGDIFISKERIKENATSLKVLFNNEMKRVIVHGLLHLCGFADKTKKQKDLMRQKEDFYLAKYN